MHRKPSRKRPCRICKHWFLPNPRLKERQKTCGSQKCQKAWHRKICTQWNRKNVDYFKSNYLAKKIEEVDPHSAESSTTSNHRSSRIKSGLPAAYVQGMIGNNLFVILEYLAQLIDQRWSKDIRRQDLVKTGHIGQQPRRASSRGDTSLNRCNH
jgi:hypothetical protein